MRLAVIVVSMLALTAPLQASNSCLVATEARQHSGSAYLSRHGSADCREVAPSGQRHVRYNQPGIDRAVRRKRGRSGWRQAMSEMLPDDGRVPTPVVLAVSGTAEIGANWLDRWVEIVPVIPPQTQRSPEPAAAETPTASPVLAREPESAGMPHIVVALAFFAFVLIFATVEILLRNDEEKR
jgi:hypothetical protein